MTDLFNNWLDMRLLNVLVNERRTCYSECLFAQHDWGCRCPCRSVFHGFIGAEIGHLPTERPREALQWVSPLWEAPRLTSDLTLGELDWLIARVVDPSIDERLDLSDWWFWRARMAEMGRLRVEAGGVA